MVTLRSFWNLGAGLILYLWSVRPSYDLSLRLLVPFLFVGPPIAAARGRPDFVAVAIETAAAVFFFYFGGVMLNDLCDLEIDRISHPERPLPGGSVDRASVVFGAVLFFAIAITIAIVFRRAPLVLLALIGATTAHFTFTKKRLKIAGASALITSIIVSMLGWYAARSADAGAIMALLLSMVLFFGLAASNILNGVEDRDAEGGIVGNLSQVFDDRVCVRLASASTLLALLAAVALWLVLGRPRVFALVTLVAAVQAFGNYRRLLREESPARKQVHEGLLGAVRFIGLITLAMAGSVFP